MKPGDLNRVDVSGWVKEYVNLEGLNAKLKSPLKIETTSEHAGGTQYDGPRIGRSTTGEVVAIEYESAALPTYCLVSPKVPRRK
jgi:hypothetical protein